MTAFPASSAIDMTDSCILEAEKGLFEDALPELILFVCTGNTCRSPMAAALFNHLYGEDKIAVSAGLAADGGLISTNAVYALRQREIPSTEKNDYENHRSRTVTAEMMKAAERVIGISARHAVALIAAFPEYAEKIEAMPSDISDPFGGSKEDYVQCLKNIEEAEKILFHETEN